MTDTSSSIFNKKATEKLRSPDDLDKFVRVTNPSIWVVLLAVIALLAGLLAWAFFGTVATSVTSTGAVVDGVPMCFLQADDVTKVAVGDTVNVGGESMKVVGVSSVPVSRNEAGKILKSDYLVSSLVQGDWAYQVVFEGDVAELNEDVPLAINITTERLAPISLILKSRG